MIVYNTKTDLARHLEKLRGRGLTIGLVPTMGALHKGHLSLAERSIRENDATVVTIFVNPTQFNDPSDLELYPRTPEKDLELLEKQQVDLLFMPSVEEMYPEPDVRSFDLQGLDLVMEGARRKGHFNGVAQIVSKLFEAVKPQNAYFGQKDFQQLVIVKHLVKIMGLEMKIVACPIIRESDGLAMSSRNVRLSPQEREIAPFIYQTLSRASQLRTELSPAGLKTWVREAFSKQPRFKLDYFEIVEDKALRTVEAWSDAVNKVGCIAVVLGRVRLIDNMIFD
ncbi:MAG: pantoate--beta-alanine ligase [Bacteroidota bacterium]